MTIHVWTKQETQGTLTDFRNNGFTVVKTSWGYEVEQDGEQLFSALTQQHNYIVRYKEGIFGEEGEEI
jgi:hypothetical protein